MNRQSIFKSSDSDLQDLDMSTSNATQNEDDAIREEEEEESESEKDEEVPQSKVNSFVNQRVTTFLWNMECIAGNIADVFAGPHKHEKELVEIDFSNP